VTNMRKCVVCGRELSGRQELYCSRACQQRAYRQRKARGPDEVLVFLPQGVRQHMRKMALFFKPAGISKERWQQIRDGEAEYLRPAELSEMAAVYDEFATLQRFGKVSRHHATIADISALKR